MSRSRLARFSRVEPLTLAFEQEARKQLGAEPIVSQNHPSVLPSVSAAQMAAVASAVGRTFSRRRVEKKVEELAGLLNLAALDVATARRKAQKEQKHAHRPH